MPRINYVRTHANGSLVTKVWASDMTAGERNPWESVPAACVCMVKRCVCLCCTMISTPQERTRHLANKKIMNGLKAGLFGCLDWEMVPDSQMISYELDGWIGTVPYTPHVKPYVMLLFLVPLNTFLKQFGATGELGPLHCPRAKALNPLGAKSSTQHYLENARPPKDGYSDC